MYVHVGAIDSQEGTMHEYLITLVGRAVIDLLSSEDDNVLDIVEYLYVGIDWRGCPNI
jgi:hypothetical protein